MIHRRSPWPLLALASLLAARSLGGRAPDGEQPVDLVFYGDTRGGVLQTFLNHHHKPSEIHRAIASRIGSLEGLADQRGIVFLGDAVSHGGCSKYWEEDFFPAVRKLTAFQRGQDFLFYPVIGDHETYLIPESYEEAFKVPVQCALFRYVYRAPAESGTSAPQKVSRAIHTELTSERGIPAQTRCPTEPEPFCSNPSIAHNDILKAHCAACAYQRERCRGNCVTYAFIQSYSRENGFGPLQEAWGESPEGATWYKVDYSLANGAGERRSLRALLLDTQAAADLHAGDGKSQAEWMEDRVAELPVGAFLVVAGHQPPPLRADLYASIFRAAFRRGVRVLAVVAAHYHGFGSGVYTVSSIDVPNAPAQEVYFALSGDGGGRDFDQKELPTEARMVGATIGGSIHVTPKPGSGWSVDTVRDASSFVRIRVTYDGPEITDYRVPLASVLTSSRGGPKLRTLQAKKETALRSLTPGAAPR